MNITDRWKLIALAAAVCLAACSGMASKEQIAQGQQMVEEAQKAKNFDRLLTLSDSLEQARCLTPAQADYWRGYAYDRLKQPDQAKACWLAAMQKAEAAGNAEADIYAKAASHLANMLCVVHDFETTLQIAQPAVKRLEELQCDTTSDYANLLIYIGCSQGRESDKALETKHSFELACQKHMEMTRRHHTDEAYKNAIAGLINIAYFSVRNGHYEDALYYTRHFGELLGEYEQRTGISADYVDRQLGRYDIYKAQALASLGQREEAQKVFEAFEATNYSQSSEGQALADDYQKMINQDNE